MTTNTSALLLIVLGFFFVGVGIVLISHFSPSGTNWDKVLSRLGALASIIVAIVAVVALRHSSESAKAAVTAAKENTSNFKVQNMPYLQVGDFKLIGDTFTYKIFNLGGYPAKVISGKFGILTYWLDDPFSTTKNVIVVDGKVKELKVTDLIPEGAMIEQRPTFDQTIINNYVIKESPIEKIHPENFPILGLGGPTLNLGGNSYIIDYPYFYGEIVYTNEISNQTRQYNFAVRLFGSKEKINAEFKRNENINL